MPFLNITVSGMEQVRQRLTTLSPRLMRAVTTAVVMSGEEAAMSLRAAAPVGTGATAGQLAESFHNQPLDISYTRAATQVITTQPQILRYVRYGTGIYGPSGAPIVPRRARALYWEGAQHPVRSVRGSPPNDFVTPALLQAREAALARLTAAVGATLAE